jgi:Fe-S-cluster containining protein
VGEKRWGDDSRRVMDERDGRVEGRLTRRLRKLARDVMDPDDMLEPDNVEIRDGQHRYDMPDCAHCEERCCVHKEPGMGILLSLQDVAHLADSGFEDLIVGTFTFKKKKGKILDEIDKMPRLAKKQGYCIFYDPDAGTCTGYRYRPTICRRYPFEVEYKKGSGKPFAHYIPDAPCPRVRGEQYDGAIREMCREAVHDENISLEDAEILPEHHEALREIGFGRWLPPEWECPEPSDDD